MCMCKKYSTNVLNAFKWHREDIEISCLVFAFVYSSISLHFSLTRPSFIEDLVYPKFLISRKYSTLSQHFL